MTIIVEDGSVVANANSYISVADANAYFTTTGDTLWTEDADDAAKERALILGAQYMQQKWRLRWKGSRIEAQQRLDWPRTGVDVPDFFDPFLKNTFVPVAFQNTYFIPADVIPQEVIDAQLLLATASLSDDGQSAVSLQTSLGRLTKKEKAAVLEVEYFAPGEGGSSRQTTNYWDAKQIIQPFLRASSRFTGSVVRA